MSHKPLCVAEHLRGLPLKENPIALDGCRWNVILRGPGTGRGTVGLLKRAIYHDLTDG